MNKLSVISGVLMMVAAGSLSAETKLLHCEYTDATYNAAFMGKPETRQCPQSKCYYDIRYDSDGGLASINGTIGYSVDRSPSQLVFRRTSVNPVMGGRDTAVFTVDLDKMTFVGEKTTTPSVTVTTMGSCTES